MSIYAEAITGDHQPLLTDGIPTVSASETKIAADAPAARRYLARHGALDLADMLGIGGVA